MYQRPHGDRCGCPDCTTAETNLRRFLRDLHLWSVRYLPQRSTQGREARVAELQKRASAGRPLFEGSP
jgi:hypothetical protein